MTFDTRIFFLSFVEKIQVSLISDKNNGYFTCSAMKIFDHEFNPFRKLCHLSDNVENYCRAGQATDDNMGHVH